MSLGLKEIGNELGITLFNTKHLLKTLLKKIINIDIFNKLL